MRRARARTLLLTVAGLLCFASPAGAATVNLGQIAPPGAPGSCSGCTGFQLQTDAASPSYVVPPGGPWTVTSWSARGGATTADAARLRVFRPAPVVGRFDLVAESAQVPISVLAAPVTPVSIAVLPGDLLGLRTFGGAGDMPLAHSAVSANDRLAAVTGDILLGQSTGPGGTFPYAIFPANRVNVSATLTAPDPAGKNPPAKKKCKKAKKKKKRKPAASVAKKKKKCGRKKKKKG